MTSARVLVLGEESRVIVTVVRSLARAGHETELAWCPADEPARASRHLTATHDLTPYAPDEETWWDELEELHRRRGFDAVMPTTEAATWVLHHARDRWVDAGIPVVIGNATAVDAGFDKLATWDLARSCSIPVPDALAVGSGADVGPLLTLGPPYVVKPARSIDPDTLDKVSVAIVGDPADVPVAVDRAVRAAGAAQVQAHIPGHGVGVEVLADGGDVLLDFQHRRLHETTGYGSTYRVSEVVNPELQAATATLVAALDLTGVAMFEFRVDGETGRWVLLEINPRFWGSLPLSVAAGVDFPAAWLALALDGREAVQSPADARPGVRSRDLLNDLRWTWRQLRPDAASDPPPDAIADADALDGDPVQEPDDRGWATNQVDRRTLLGDVGRLVTLRDNVDLFDLRDPGPGLAELRRASRLAVERLFRRKR